MLKAFGVVALFATVVSSNPARLCPDGFSYAGDDSPGVTLVGKGYWSEEIASSPDYSCYKWVAGRGFHDAYHECSRNENSEIVAFEDESEAKRFFLMLFNSDNVAEAGEANRTVLTSAMYFYDVRRWVWLGSDYQEVPVKYHKAPTNDLQCLAITGSWRKAVQEDISDKAGESKAATISVDDISLKWEAVQCHANITFGCEVRARTVTYVTWFYTNWLTLLLLFLVVVLIVSLCVSAATRRNRIVTGMRPYRGNACSPRAVQRPVQPAQLVLEDLPPKYSDVAGNANGEGGRFDKYVGKGKEMFGKIYLYRK